MNEFDRLQAWFSRQCDGDWEHQLGVEISTLDNPGWMVSIDLVGTDLEERSFLAIELHRSDDDWVVCKVEGQRFVAFGGPRNLSELVRYFVDWTGGTKVEG